MTEAAEIDWEDEARLESELDRLDQWATSKEERMKDLFQTFMADPNMWSEAFHEIAATSDPIASITEAGCGKDFSEIGSQVYNAVHAYCKYCAKEMTE